MTLTPKEIKELQAGWRKLAKVIGPRPRPPQKELDRRYREVMGRPEPTKAPTATTLTGRQT